MDEINIYWDDLTTNKQDEIRQIFEWTQDDIDNLRIMIIPIATICQDV